MANRRHRAMDLLARTAICGTSEEIEESPNNYSISQITKDCKSERTCRKNGAMTLESRLSIGFL